MDRARLHRAWNRGRAFAPDEWVLAALAGAVFAGQLWLFVRSVGLRLATAYPHDWIEGLSLLHAFAMERGWPAYHAPHAESVPPLYTPGLAYLLRPLVSQGLATYAAARLVSVLAIVAALVVLARIVRREGGGLALAALGGAVFLGTYPAVDRVYDMGRVDALALGAFALGLDLATRPGRGTVGDLGAGLALVGATFSKQSYGLLSLALLVLVSLRRPGRALRAGLVYAGVGGVLAAALESAGQGWFLSWTLRMPSLHPFEAAKAGVATGPDLEAAFPLPVLAGIPLALLVRFALPHRSGPGGLALPGLAAVAYGLGYLQRLKVAGHVNVWTPFFYLAALALPVALADLRRLERRYGPGSPAGLSRPLRHVLLVVACLGALLRGYDPAAGQEGRSADQAVDGIRRCVAAAPAPVLCPVLPELVEMAGGGPQYSMMPVWDMAYAGLGTRVLELAERVRRHHYAAVLLPLELAPYVEGLEASYLPVASLAVPVMTSGNRLAEHWIWLPRERGRQPRGIATDFEAGEMPGWTPVGPAFAGAVRTGVSLGREADGAHGGWLLASGDPGTGTGAVGALVSQGFVLDGSGVSLLLGGSGRCQVELRHGERVLARVRPTGGARLRRAYLPGREVRGREVTLAIRDDDERPGGVVLVDDLVVVEAAPALLGPGL